MLGNHTLDPLISSIIAIVSGIGFVVLLAVTPVKEGFLNKGSADSTNPSQKQTNTNTSTQIKPSFPESEWRDFPDYLPIIPKNQRKQLIEEDKLPRTYIYDRQQHIVFLPGKSDYIPNSGDIYYQWKKEGLEVKSITKNILLEDSNPLHKQKPLYSPEELKHVDVSYDLTPGVSALFRSSVVELNMENREQSRLNMAGVNFSSGKILSTKFFAGDMGDSQPVRYGSSLNSSYIDPLIANRNSMGLANNRSKKMFEWQTLVQPSKNFGFETSIYNSSGSSNVYEPREGARFSLFFGTRFLQLNLKYNFLTEDLLKSINQQKDINNHTTDFAGLGLTLFLDKYKQYSLYVGNNYYNVATSVSPLRTDQIPGSNSFTAMFKGKNQNLLNSTIFINFRNQYYKDLIFSNYGVFKLPVYSQSSLEYATAMGLEMIF